MALQLGKLINSMVKIKVIKRFYDSSNYIYRSDMNPYRIKRQLFDRKHSHRAAGLHQSFERVFPMSDRDLRKRVL